MAVELDGLHTYPGPASRSRTGSPCYLRGNHSRHSPSSLPVSRVHSGSASPPSSAQLMDSFSCLSLASQPSAEGCVTAPPPSLPPPSLPASNYMHASNHVVNGLSDRRHEGTPASPRESEVMPDTLALHNSMSGGMPRSPSAPWIRQKGEVELVCE